VAVHGEHGAVRARNPSAQVRISRRTRPVACSQRVGHVSVRARLERGRDTSRGNPSRCAWRPRPRTRRPRRSRALPHRASTSSSTWLRPIRSLCSRWILCRVRCGCAASRPLEWHARRVDVPRARAREPQIATPRTASATALTDSKSPSLAIGKPASITSTPSRSSCRASASFSPRFMLQPGDCSPSRSVVSRSAIVRSSLSPRGGGSNRCAGGAGTSSSITPVWRPPAIPPDPRARRRRRPRTASPRARR